MNRLLLRLSALGLIVMVGLIAIARAQRSGSPVGSDPQQAAGDPFAGSQSVAEATASDAGNASGSSVRLVSVQDFPSESQSVPPRSVPSGQQPAGGATGNIVPTGNATASDAAIPTASGASAGNSVFPGRAMLVSATVPVDSSSELPPAASGGHSIYSGTMPPAAPIEVAQAPATLDPPPGATPLMPVQPAPAQQLPSAGQVPPTYGASAFAPSAFAGPTAGAASTTSGHGAPPVPQSAPQPAADAGPVFAPIASQAAAASGGNQPSNQPGIPASIAAGMTIDSLRPIDSNLSAASAVEVNSPTAALHPDSLHVDAFHPDAKHVEGSQSPQLTIEKIAPTEVQVGKPARFELRVRNVGSATAQGVEIHDAVPQGLQFVSSNPPTTQGPDGQLAWSLGELKPGEQTNVQLEMLPVAEGDIRSSATVTFRTEVSVRTLATRPRLTLQLSAPKQVLIGDTATMTVIVSNPGTGAATGVVLTEHVPHALRHKAGSDLEFDVGTLKPGQSRRIELSMSTVEAGHVVNALQARGDAKLHAQARVEFDIVAPALSVAMSGPTRRYLERQATYTVAVSNPGTAPARDVELVTQLPKGMQFVKANNAGHYDPQTRTVTWNLEELPPAETGSVTLVAVPVEAGEQRMKIEGKAKQGLSDAKEKTVIVEGLAAVTFDVRGADEAIEVGGETTYSIHVVNEGSLAATNLQVAALFPPELKPLRAEGPARNSIDRRAAAAGFAVRFEPIARLEPKGEATFRIRAHAIQPGDLRVKVQVQTDDMHEPVLKEENTRVYVDH